jgi:hypothetical protein
VVVEVIHAVSAPVALLVQPDGSAGAVTVSKDCGHITGGVGVNVAVLVAVLVGVVVAVFVAVLVAVFVGVDVDVFVGVFVGVPGAVCASYAPISVPSPAFVIPARSIVRVIPR